MFRVYVMAIRPGEREQDDHTVGYMPTRSLAAWWARAAARWLSDNGWQIVAAGYDEP